MKKILFSFFTLAVAFAACNNSDTKTNGPTASGTGISLPYTAGYTTEFTKDVSDSDLLLVLNSYKYWETGDMKAIRSTMGDSMIAEANGFKFNGASDSLLNIWKNVRDSLSSVSITMDVWLKNHAVIDSSDYVNVWYKEIDTYRSGRVDSANYADINKIKNGKLVWYSQFKQQLK